MTDENRISGSRWGRLVKLAGLGAKVGVARLMGATEQEASEAEVVKATAQTLGQLRGLALKLGQMASYLDGMVPQEHQELYEKGLRGLRDAAPSMPPEVVARVVREELGAPPRELFAQWEDQPLASASIGQVHRARMADGRPVAVKVQHENVQQAVRADLDNASLFSSLLGPLGGRLGVKEQMAELRARFLEELDYRHEAAAQRDFGTLFAQDARVRIPAVVDERVSPRVLTTGLAEGLRFDEACAQDEEARRAWAETLWRFVFGSLLRAGRFNADPHPGNYLFAPEGTVWCLDFGCTRTHSAEKLALVRACHQEMLAGHEQAVTQVLAALFEMPSHGEQMRRARAFMGLCFEPILHPGRYHVTRAYVQNLMKEMQGNVSALVKGPRNEFAPLPAEFLFFNRLQFGFYSVLARLDVAVDYGSLHAALVAESRAA